MLVANKKDIPVFGIKDEIGYVFGDMAGSFVNLFVDAYFLTFCTYVLGVKPGWMASLFLFHLLYHTLFFLLCYIYLNILNILQNMQEEELSH